MNQNGLAPAHVRLRTLQDPLPQPERDYIRLTVTADDRKGQEAVAFAVHKRVARQCKLLDAILDELDLMEDDSGGMEGSATVPEADPEACIAVFDFLESTTTRVPTLIARPLRAPLKEILQPWELRFLTEVCLERGDPKQHEKLLAVMKVSDFLIIDPLRDLCCAFLASLVMECNTESELLSLLGMQRPPTVEEMEPLYEQFPFLR